MKKRTRILGYIGIAVIMAFMVPAAKADSCCPGEKHAKGHSDNKDKTVQCAEHVKADVLEKVLSGHFPMISKSIDKALNALEKGDEKTAKLELKKAKMMTAIIGKMVAKHTKPEFVNAKCPIMGSPINPDKVAKNLIREYKGQKVAFCCAGCPEKWDDLSDSKKQAKLAKVEVKSENALNCPMHSQGGKASSGKCPKSGK